ncbi:MAG: PilZ domain-containing protein [Elusimicrobiota bacterium]
MVEKRQHPRKKSSTRVSIKSSGNTGRAWIAPVIDMSMDGIAFEIEEKLNEGDDIELNSPPFAATLKATVKG